MSTRETWNRCGPRTQHYDGAGGPPGHTWEDVQIASQGMAPGLYAFIRYTQYCEAKARHQLFAGMLEEAMRIKEVREFGEARRPKTIETLVRIAIIELAPYMTRGLTAEQRALCARVSRATWYRAYAKIYDRVLAIPKHWEEADLRKVGKRLR